MMPQANASLAAQRLREGFVLLGGWSSVAWGAGDRLMMVEDVRRWLMMVEDGRT